MIEPLEEHSGNPRGPLRTRRALWPTSYAAKINMPDHPRVLPWFLTGPNPYSAATRALAPLLHRLTISGTGKRYLASSPLQPGPPGGPAAARHGAARRTPQLPDPSAPASRPIPPTPARWLPRAEFWTARLARPIAAALQARSHPRQVRQCIGDLGVPSASFNAPTGHRSCALEDSREYMDTPRQGPAPVTGVFPAGVDLRLLEAGIQAIRLSPYRAGRPAGRPVRLGTTRRFPGMLRSLFPHGSR